MSNMSFRASRRLSEFADRAADRAADRVEEELAEEAEVFALDFAEEDEMLADLVEAAYRLDDHQNRHRKEVADPFNDDLLDTLRSARDEADDAVDKRLEQIVDEAVEAARSVEPVGGEAE